MIEQCRLEVNQLHQFFEDWFNAKITNSDEGFSRFGDVMNENFQMVPPSAIMANRSELMTSLRNAHGAWSSKQPPWEIEIRNFDGRMLGEGICLVTYEEWQGQSNDTKRGRRSTALFKYVEGNFNNLEWIHVHETWITT